MTRTRLYSCLAVTGLVTAAWCGATIAQQTQSPSSDSQDQAQSQSQSQRPTPQNVARDNEGGKNDASYKIARSDRKFMEKVSKDNAAEIEAGKLASTKGSNDQVKQFGERMVQDHGKAADELKQLAQSKGLDLPDAADRKHEREAKSLDKKSGADFDKAYMQQMVKDHRADLKELQKEAKNARDPEVKAFAEKTAQVVQEHLDMAQQIAADVGAKGGARNASAKRDKSASIGRTGGGTSRG
jgi:putative membrane protein